MRADRLITILLLLQSHGMLTAAELAKRLEVSKRTVYRDVEALSMAGVPVYARPGVEGGIMLDEAYRFTPGVFSRPELQALLVGSGGRVMQDLGLERASGNALLKLLAALPSILREEAQRMRQRVYVDPEGWFEDEEPLPNLPLVQQAVWGDAVLRMTYQHTDGTLVEREVEAYALVAKASTWYLLGCAPGAGTEQLRTFRVARIQSAALTGAIFQRPADFDLAGVWSQHSRAFVSAIKQERVPFEALVRVREGAPQHVLVKDFSGRYIRDPQPDDPPGWVSLRINFPSWYAARMRVLSLGEVVEVLAPESFRQDLRAELERVARKYGDRNKCIEY